MSSFTSLSTLSKSEPSLCIPWVFPNITDRRIAYVFKQLHLGEIERIDMVQRDNHQRVFIHFKEWSITRDANAVREKLVKGEEVKLVYDEPWFWKVSASRVNKVNPRRADKPKPRIELLQKPVEEEWLRELEAQHIAENDEPCPGCESDVDCSAAHCDKDGNYPHPNCCSAPGCV